MLDRKILHDLNSSNNLLYFYLKCLCLCSTVLPIKSESGYKYEGISPVFLYFYYFQFILKDEEALVQIAHQLGVTLTQNDKSMAKIKTEILNHKLEKQIRRIDSIGSKLSILNAFIFLKVFRPAM